MICFRFFFLSVASNVHSVHVYVHELQFWHIFNCVFIKMASPKEHSVHVYVHEMQSWRIFGCVFGQNGVPKTAFRARIRVHNALLVYFWVRFASNFGLQMFIPCTYTCTNCAFGIFRMRFLVQKVIWSLHSSALNFVTYFSTIFCQFFVLKSSFRQRFSIPNALSDHFLLVFHYQKFISSTFFNSKCTFRRNF